MFSVFDILSGFCKIHSMNNNTEHTKPSLGIPEMDTQHDYLYLLFEQLLKQHSRDDMSNLLDEIAGYLDFHITSEEHLIRLYKVPGLAAHRSDHELAAQTLLRYIDDFERGDFSPGRLYKAMTGWLYEHTLDSDMKYAEFIKPLRNKMQENQ
jgi:hemerythrin-like metal-binding protein